MKMKSKKIKPTEKEIEKTLGGIFDVIIAGMKEEDKKSPIFDFIAKQIKHLDNPAEFYTMAIFPVERIIRTFIETKFKKDNHLAPEIYLRYYFFENHLSKLCQNLYGNACCVDRASFLLRAALKWKQMGEIPIFNWEQKYTFYIPPTGTSQQWMSFIEGIQSLLYGNSVKYCMALKILIEEHNNKQIAENKKIRENETCGSCGLTKPCIDDPKDFIICRLNGLTLKLQKKRKACDCWENKKQLNG